MTERAHDSTTTTGITGYDSNNWWRCHHCNALVPNGCTHNCPTSVQFPPTTGYPPPLPYAHAATRIAYALERIAAALERKPA